MAKKYIDCEAVLEQITKIKDDFSPTVRPMFDVFKHILSEAPAAKVAPMVYAYWDWQCDGTHFCSECGTDALYTDEGRELCSLWCPHCGAYMTEVKNDA
jgi:NADH pyrophosphatase NudC (nudix superfamily)